MHLTADLDQRIAVQPAAHFLHQVERLVGVVAGREEHVGIGAGSLASGARAGSRPDRVVQHVRRRAGEVQALQRLPIGGDHAVHPPGDEAEQRPGPCPVGCYEHS